MQDRSQDGPRPPQGLLRRVNLPLRLRLSLLVLAAVVPMTAFGLIDGYRDYRATVERVGRERQLLARAMAIAVDSELRRSIAAMQVLAQSRRLLEQDMIGFRRRANDVIDQQFPGANILLLRPDGQQLMNTAVAPGELLPRRRDLTTLRQALATGQPSVSDLFYGQVVRRFVVSIDVPFHDEHGQLAGVIALNPQAATFAGLVDQHRPPGDWIVELVDRQGVIISRSPHSLRHVGQKTQPALLEALRAGPSGVVELSSRDGAPLLAVFTRGETFGWTVILGIPREQLTGPAIASALRTLAIGGIFLAIGLALALIAARRIAEPIGNLRTIAATAGSDIVLPPASTGLRETDDVATALWASQNRRQRSEQRYRTLFDATPDAVCVFDLDTRRFLEVNAATIRQYGWTRDELLSMTLYDTHAPQEPSRLRGPIADLPDTPYLMRHRRKDGTIFDAECAVRIIEYDGRRVGLALARDVTEQKLARTRLAEAIEAFPGSFRLYDRDEKLVLTNGKSWAPADTRLNARIGQTVEETVRAAAESEAYAACVGRKEAWYRERLAEFRRGQTDSEVRLRDGRWIQVLERRTADGGTISVRMDISARKAIEDQLRQAQKMETVGQLTGGIAHDFNNTLAVIMASFEDIVALELEGTDIHACAETGLKATEQAAALTNRLLAFSRRQELAPVELDVVDVVRDLHKMLRSAVPPAIELVVQTAPGRKRCVLDRTQLETAVMNLVVNARDAIGERSGEIGIAIDNRVIGPREAAASSELRLGHWVAVTISDNGSGMPEDVRARIFEPFFTTKEVGKGTGLGLSQIHGFVAQSGGFVTVQSDIGLGTHIVLHFPAKA
ncbi:MAG: PAS domain S-box protein [Alphaproteobacteria bacterium]|nr:PAS domain S-box protein [Alphaproteobacteria bacterium]MCW5739987.1 PAS domain S-box protein [Alphaproteobacteria bacterium]